MARPGMTRWRGKSTAGTEGCDDVQKSLELLDKVLSEFDDLENGNLDREEGGEKKTRTQTLRNSLAGRSESSETTGNVSTTPEDDSPSLGHQSEDDGYMSMNGKRGKFVLSFRPVPDETGSNELPPVPDPPPDPPPEEMADYPPPPEEAERIISNLLPKVSPVNSSKKLKQNMNHSQFGNPRFGCKTFGKDSGVTEMDTSLTAATQTTFPKTRHQRPYGWENAINQIPLELQYSHQQPQGKYSSLPYEGALHHSRYPPPWLQKPGPLPPRTLACALDRHREVRRGNSGDVSSPVKYINENPVDDNPGNFSDDSLEEAVPPVNKRGSLAWEVPFGFEDDDSYLTPGSTKVIGRRRRKSTDHSSSNSIHRLRDTEDWPEPPPSTEDEACSLYSDSYYDSNETEDLGLPEALPLDLTFNGTYVIRKGRKKERSCMNSNLGFNMTKPSNPKHEMQTGLEEGGGGGGRMVLKPSPDLKRASSTFDNLKSLLREELIEGLDDPPPDFSPPNPPKIVRVVSLPSLPLEDVEETANVTDGHHRNSKCERFSKLNELEVTLEEAEDELSSLENPSLNQEVERRDGLCNCIDGKKSNELETSLKSMKKCNEVETQTDLSDIEAQNELEIVGKQISDISKTKSELEEVEKKIQEIVKIKTVIENQAREEEFSDPWVKATDIKLPKMVPVFEEKPPNEFHVNVEVLEHDFGPLPPSPVEENDEEYTDVFHPGSIKSSRGKGDALPEPFYRCQEPSGSDPSGKYLNRPPEPLPHRTSDPISTNLASRSKDASFGRNQRLQYANGSRRENTAERRTLPSEFPGPVSRRRTFQKRSSTLPQENTQTSCSLPETPIFSRGCDIPRTPHRRGPDAIRPGGLQNSTYRRNGTVSNSACNTGVSLTGGLNQALAGAELLRLAGGPGRGWYPRHRQHRPASIEQLDRIAHSGTSPGNGLPGPWDIGSCRKPMTLPPNITPKFFHRSPRDALRRVTSLLIRGKGTTSKEKKEVLPPPVPQFGDPAGHCKQKKGFFRNFWKKSKHYSLDQQ